VDQNKIQIFTLKNPFTSLLYFFRTKEIFLGPPKDFCVAFIFDTPCIIGCLEDAAKLDQQKGTFL
jgi:hypothetical protein